MPQRFQKDFPEFYRALMERGGAQIEQVLPPATDAEIGEIETQCGVPLPVSYRRLLRCARGFDLLGGVVQFCVGHPFFHDFPPREAVSAKAIRRSGGVWPPPSQGMLCFAEFFMEADGDQMLWDVSRGLCDGEYPIYYYAHNVPSVRQLSANFESWLGEFLNYREFSDKQAPDDTSAIAAAIDMVIAANPDKVEQVKAKPLTVSNWFVGQVMKATGGKANPKAVYKLLKSKLDQQ